MASALACLKREIKSLSEAFGKDHPCFRISAVVDEITCKFINKNKELEFKANVAVRVLIVCFLS